MEDHSYKLDNIILLAQILLSLILSLYLYISHAKRGLSWYIPIISILIFFLVFNIILFLPYDIYISTLPDNTKKSNIQSKLKLAYTIIYWATFILTLIFTPIIKGYIVSGNFQKRKKLADSLKSNIKFYVISGILGVIAFIAIIIIKYKIDKAVTDDFLTSVFRAIIDISNMYGIIIVMFSLGYSFIELPKFIYYKNYDLNYRIKYLEYRTGKLIDSLNKNKSKLIISINQIRSTIDFINNNPQDKDAKNISKYQLSLLTIVEKFNSNKEIMYGITNKDMEFNNEPPIKIDTKLIEINSNINQIDIELSYTKMTLDKIYKEWEYKNNLKYYIHNEQNSNKNNEQNENNINNDILLTKKSHFIPSKNFKISCCYSPSTKKSSVIFEIIIILIMELLIISFEISLLLTNIIETSEEEKNKYCYFCKIIAYFNNISSIFTYILVLIPLVFVFFLSIFAFLNFRIKNFISIHSNKRTDGYSLMSLVNFMCTISFAICVHFNKLLIEYQDTILYQNYKLSINNETANNVYDTIPMVLVVFMVLNLLNIFTKLKVFKNSGSYDAKDKESGNVISNGKEYLYGMQMKKIEEDNRNKGDLEKNGDKGKEIEMEKNSL